VSDLHAHLDYEHADEHSARAIEAPAHAPVTELASEIGNQNFGQLISRMGDGEGILSSGVAHPAVESAIAAARGGGAPLDSGLSHRFGNSLGRTVDDVRVHTGPAAAALTRAVSARAFATGRDIFFAPGEYQPHSPGGRELIAHEVAHTDQQLGAPKSGPLVVSQPGDALEHEAHGVARDLLA